MLSGMVKDGLSLYLALKRGWPLPLKNAWKASESRFRTALTTEHEYAFSQGNSPLFLRAVNALLKEKKLTEGEG